MKNEQWKKINGFPVSLWLEEERTDTVLSKVYLVLGAALLVWYAAAGFTGWEFGGVTPTRADLSGSPSGGHGRAGFLAAFRGGK
jgi:hypothetical protein